MLIGWNKGRLPRHFFPTTRGKKQENPARPRLGDLFPQGRMRLSLRAELQDELALQGMWLYSVFTSRKTDL